MKFKLLIVKLMRWHVTVKVEKSVNVYIFEYNIQIIVKLLNPFIYAFKLRNSKCLMCNLFEEFLSTNMYTGMLPQNLLLQIDKWLLRVDISFCPIHSAIQSQRNTERLTLTNNKLADLFV